MIEIIELEWEDKIYVIPEFSEVDADDLKLKYRDDVFSAIYSGLVYMLSDSTVERIPCFILNEVVFEIDLEGAQDHIINCIEYFTEIEEYEKCSILINLKTKLQ